MSDTDFELPEWEECSEKAKAGTATPLEIFIFNHEPAGKQDIKFREELAAVVKDLLERYRQ